jgi:hypothetical protein
MQRLALSFALASAALLTFSAAVVPSGHASAFEINAVPSGSAGTAFGDPDEASLPTPPSSPKLQEDGTSLQIAPVTGNSPNPADNPALIPAPAQEMPAWTYSGASAQRFR